jgi:HlyD family secretion protein
MIQKFNSIGLMVGIPGLILQVVGKMITRADQVGIGLLVTLAGTVMLLIGLAYYAKAKGRHPAWCLLAFLSLVGLILMACLKDCAVEGQPKESAMRKAVLVAVVVMVAIGGVGSWLLLSTGDSGSTLRTSPVKRGDLLATISATGTVEPEEVVDVGAQVAGQILAFGKDRNGKAIDYGSEVEEGTILAQIDDSLYTADVQTNKAQLAQARANQVRAEADLEQMKAKLEQARRDWERAQKLGPSEALAPTTYDAYQANFEIAKANLAVGQAVIEQTKAAVIQAQTALDRSQRNLGYCTIKSPVKGVIIDRRVNIGQTVVASLSAPSLFLIAKDLRRVQVWVAVNEADIGSIRPGQPVTFTVDAFPGRTFKGQVSKIRLNATMTQNVVTYTVEIATDNSDSRLLPYLTANLLFETGRRQDVLIVPNAALRWQPRPELIAPEFRNEAAPGQGKPEGSGKPADSGKPAGAGKASDEGKPAEAGAAPRGEGRGEGRGGPRRRVWVEQGKFVRPIVVQAGLTDGTQTEVQGEGLAEGLNVVVGELVQAGARPAGATGAGGSPFTPQIGRPRPANQSGGSGGGGSGGGPGAGPGGGR